MHTKILLCFFFVLATSVTVTITQLSFPETDTNDNRKPQHMRQPVTSSKCQVGELLYPGDNNADWACDCRPVFLYYPADLRCYEAYTQGPCRQNEVLVLPKGKVIPICYPNNCGVGRINYNQKCTKIGSHEGCKQPSIGAKTHLLIVNSTTLQLNCAFTTHSRSPEFINEEQGTYEEPACFLGGKRSQESTCE